jgi:acetyltransferase-like isoleucine patch superfamily enzyme
LVGVYLRIHGVSIGTGLRVRSLPFCRCYGNGRIEIGNNLTINNTLRENPGGVVHKTVLYAGRGSVLRIGNDVGISGAILHAQDPITIGDRCLLGANCSIFTSDFHGLHPADRRVPSAAHKAPVVLEEDVWIGANATILKGVTVGKGSIVGASSVVTRNVPAGTIVMGNPARVIAPLPSDSATEMAQERERGV